MGESVRLWGREDEIELMNRLAAGVGEAAGGVVIVGEPGIGKSSLWAYGMAVLRRTGARVLATTCAEAESEMPYAGLDDLLGPLLDGYGSLLPAGQRAALDSALLRGHTDTATDGRTVAVGVLTLLRCALDRGPVVLAVDDLQWLDVETEQCLTYAVRRLADRPLTLLLAGRHESPLWRPPRQATDTAALAFALDSVSTVRLAPLPAGVIAGMLADRLGLSLSREGSRRIAAETGGNPFWALQFGQEWGGVLDGASPPALGALVPKRIADLEPRVIDAACLVAALGRPRVGTVLRAVASRGDEDVESILDRAIAAGLLTLAGDRISPSHPLIGAALVASLPPFRRRRLHRWAAELADSAEARALQLLRADAEVTDVELVVDDDPSADGRAWRAELRDALDAAGLSARHRGAPSTAARFAARALALAEQDAQTAGAEAGADEQEVLGRRVTVAELHYRAGELDAVLTMLERVDLGVLDQDLLERAGPLLAQTLNERRGGPAARAVVERPAALSLAGLSAAEVRRRQALVWTLRADLHCGAVGDRRGIAGRAVENAGASPVQLPVRRRALGVLASALLDVGDPVREVLDRLVPLENPDVAEIGSGVEADVLQGLWLLAAGDPGEACEVLDRVFARHVVTGDARGATTAAALSAYAELVGGRLTAAEETLARLGDHVDGCAMEWPHVVFTRGMVHLARGEHDALDALLSRTDRGVDGAACGLEFTDQLRGLLCLRRGDPARAVTLLGRFVDRAERRGVLEPQRRFGADVDLAEALIMVGDVVRAARIADRLDTFAHRTGRDVVRGQQRRVLAQLALRRDRDRDLGRALSLALEATALHEQGNLPVEYGRSLVTLAEVCGGRGESDAAAEHRRRACAVFAGAGQLWWANRTAAVVPASALSPSERTVVQLVVEGASNREAAAALFLSVRTVENHLAHAYRKLGIRSRTELTRTALGPEYSPPSLEAVS
ncbi:MAG: AAA family ATPase [Pseudonocardia sp.]|nr:AAA family ATPase [Pseudonocardia sp.]